MRVRRLRIASIAVTVISTGCATISPDLRRNPSSASTLSAEDIARWSKIDYSSRFSSGTDITEDGKSAIYGICDDSKLKSSGGTLFIFGPKHLAPRPVMRVDEGCSGMRLAWQPRAKGFYLVRPLASGIVLDDFRIGDHFAVSKTRSIKISAIPDFSDDRNSIAFLDATQNKIVVNSLAEGHEFSCAVSSTNSAKFRGFFPNGDILITESRPSDGTLDFYRCGAATSGLRFISSLSPSEGDVSNVAILGERIYTEVWRIEKDRRLIEIFPRPHVVRDFPTFGRMLGAYNGELAFFDRDEKDYRSIVYRIDPADGRITSQSHLIYAGDETSLSTFRAGSLLHRGSSFETEFPDLIYEDPNSNYATRLTRFADEAVGTVELPNAAPFQFRSIDGFLINGYTMNLSKDEDRPLVVGVRGGPGIWSPAFDDPSYIPHSITYFSFLAQHGYSVLLLNPRGWSNSVSWLGSKVHSGLVRGAVSDLDAAVEYIRKRGFRVSKIGVIGQSAGGIFTTWAMTLSNSISAAIPVSAAYDTYDSMFSSLNSDQTQASLNINGGDWRNGQLFTRVAPATLPSGIRPDEVTRSWNTNGVPVVPMSEFNLADPMSRIDEIKVPVLMLHGSHDSMETSAYWANKFYDAVQKSYENKSRIGTDLHCLQFKLYEDGHVFHEPINIEDYVHRTKSFFDQNLYP